jgi:hypothetical protein
MSQPPLTGQQKPSDDDPPEDNPSPVDLPVEVEIYIEPDGAVVFADLADALLPVAATLNPNGALSRLAPAESNTSDSNQSGSDQDGESPGA